MSIVESLKSFLYNNKKVITVIIIIIILIIVSIIFSKKYENYYYNRLNKTNVLKILSKECILTLRDYSNILNSTDNLRTIFLQDICNNYICNGYTLKNEEELLRLIKTISGQCIVKCILTNDIYRLALVNLKINDMITSIPYSFRNQNYPVFKRSLTNGVYGVESVNIYLADQQQTVKNIVNLYIEKIPKLYLNDEQIQENVNKVAMKENDSDIYKKFVKEFINKVKLNKENNNTIEFSIELFVILATITLYDMITMSSIEC